MSLETVAEDVTDDARDRAERIRAEADERAEEIVEEAERDAEQTRNEREGEVEATIERERDQRLSSVKLEAQQKRLEARREVLTETRADVETRIADLSGERRKDLTQILLEDAAEEFAEGATVGLYGREEDAALLASLAEDYEGFEHAGEYVCLGGVVAESDASRVRVNNTFDSILDAVWDDELKAISSRLFDE